MSNTRKIYKCFAFAFVLLIGIYFIFIDKPVFLFVFQFNRPYSLDYPLDDALWHFYFLCIATLMSVAVLVLTPNNQKLALWGRQTLKIYILHYWPLIVINNLNKNF